MKRAKKKPGRPPKRKGERLSKNRTFRVRGRLDEYLEGAAHEAGRSVSEEIEARLERSFYMDGIMLTFAGDAGPLINALSLAVAYAHLTPGLSRQGEYRAMQVAAGYIIAAYGNDLYPKDVPPPDIPASGRSERYELEGIKIALTVLKSLGLLDELSGPLKWLEEETGK